MYDEESQYSQIEIDRKKFIEGINVLNAYYISPQNRTSFVVEFSHPDEENSLIKEIVRTDIESDMLKRVLSVYSYEEILNNTHARIQITANFMKNLDDFIKGREKEDEESKEEQSTVVSLDYLKTMPTQDLFKLKLEIFEDERVQDSENRELRSNIRKSKDAIELLYNFYLIINQAD